MKENLITIFFLLLLAGSQPLAAQSWKTSREMSKRQPILVAHRGGADCIQPENSVAIMLEMLRKFPETIAGIEVDIRKTASGRLILMHDAILQRTTNGTGEVASATDDYIDSLYLKDQAGNLTAEKIPSFEEVLDLLKDTHLLLMLDVKGDFIPEVIGLVRKKEMEKQCLLLTFTSERTAIALANSETMFVSALIKQLSDFENLKKHSSDFGRMAAYISKDCDTASLTIIRDSGMMLLTDVLETTKQPFEPHSVSYYQSVISTTGVDILVTDFPLYVTKHLFPINSSNN